MITNFDAIRSLFQEKNPTEEFSVTGDMEDVTSITLIKDGSKLNITQAEVDERKKTLQAEEDAQAYARNRIYPPVSYTHLRAHETREDLGCRVML